jgi:hypothetical protein
MASRRDGHDRADAIPPRPLGDDPERVERNLIRPASESERIYPPSTASVASQGGRARHHRRTGCGKWASGCGDAVGVVLPMVQRSAFPGSHTDPEGLVSAVMRAAIGPADRFGGMSFLHRNIVRPASRHLEQRSPSCCAQGVRPWSGSNSGASVGCCHC